MSISKASRRSFLATASSAVAASVLFSGTVRAQSVVSKSAKPLAVCVFSKYLQHLGYDELAARCRDMGLDGIDLTVRDGGHVEPKNLATDLPKAVEAARKAGLEMSMISTRLCDGADKDAKPILELAGKLGIPYCRVGYTQYDLTQNPKTQLPKLADDLKALADIAAANNVVLGYHNHSGERNVGSSVWDLDWLIEKVNSPYFGSNFDFGHAKVEGGFGSWEVNTHLIASKVKMAAVKDFQWKDDKPKWCPLGTGIMPLKEMLTILKSAGFSGPLSLHFEYKTASKDDLYKEIAQAAVTLRTAMKETGMAS